MLLKKGDLLILCVLKREEMPRQDRTVNYTSLSNGQPVLSKLRKLIFCAFMK